MLPLPLGDCTVADFSLDAAVVFRDLDRPGVIRPEHLEQRRRGHASDGELLGAGEKFAPGNFPMHVEVEQVQKLLREVRCFLSFHQVLRRTMPLIQS